MRNTVHFRNVLGVIRLLSKHWCFGGILIVLVVLGWYNLLTCKKLLTTILLGSELWKCLDNWGKTDWAHYRVVTGPGSEAWRNVRRRDPGNCVSSHSDSLVIFRMQSFSQSESCNAVFWPIRRPRILCHECMSWISHHMTKSWQPPLVMCDMESQTSGPLIGQIMINRTSYWSHLLCSLSVLYVWLCNIDHGRTKPCWHLD